MGSPEDAERRDRILQRGNLPGHIAIIMDGNGRWARQRLMPRVAGHYASIESVRDVVQATGELGVKVLTLYTFSVENWSRPRDEIRALMRFLRRTLVHEADELDRNNVRLQTIGRVEDLPPKVADVLHKTIERLARNDGLLLNLAISYGGRAEIVDSVRRLLRDAQKGNIDSEQVDEGLFSSYLYTAGLPDPDLLIRTSGELRISNFLLWQIAYTEIYVTPVLWPDFRRVHLYDAVESYQRRERRFGLVKGGGESIDSQSKVSSRGRRGLG